MGGVNLTHYVKKIKYDGFSDKTVLVVGATGLIGSRIVNTLVQNQTTRVIAIGRSINKLYSMFRQFLLFANFSVVVHDINEPLPNLGQIDYIFQAAGTISGSEIKEKPVNAIKPNIIGNINCLEYLRSQKESCHHNGRLVVFSSATVYNNNGNEDIIVDESQTEIAEHLESPISPYSESKRMIEVIARSYYKQYGIDVVIARFGYVYGFSYFAPETGFFDFMNKAVRGENIRIKNPNMARRDNIYVEDAVDGTLQICLKGKSGEAYNVSSGGALNNYCSLDEIAGYMSQIVKEKFDIDTEVCIPLNGEKHRDPGIVLDNSKLKGLGWNVSYDIINGINDSLTDLYEHIHIAANEI